MRVPVNPLTTRRLTSASVSVPANSATAVQISIGLANYTALGIIQRSFSAGSYNLSVSNENILANGTTAQLTLLNRSSSAITTTVTVDILYRLG